MEEPVNLYKHLTDIEITLIKEALTEKKGNITQAARLLMLHNRSTLVEKMKKFGIRKEEYLPCKSLR